MKHHMVVTITAELIHLERGGWCPTCLVPSLVTAHLIHMFRGPAQYLTVTCCTDCGATS